MFRIIAAALLAFTFGTAVAMAGECPSPGDAPVAPNGKTATEDQMISGSQAVHAFQTSTQAYIKCVDAKEADLAALQKDAESKKDKEQIKGYMSQRKALINDHNTAVDALEKVAAQFNQAVRDYKAQSEDAKK